MSIREDCVLYLLQHGSWSFPHEEFLCGSNAAVFICTQGTGMRELLCGCTIYCSFCIFIKILSIALASPICYSIRNQYGFFPVTFVSVACLYSLTFSSCIWDHLLQAFCRSLSNFARPSVSWMTATALQSSMVLSQINCRVCSVTVSYLHFQVWSGLFLRP